MALTCKGFDGLLKVFIKLDVFMIFFFIFNRIDFRKYTKMVL